MILSQECAIVPIGLDEDGTSSLDLDSFKMNLYNHACIIIQHSASLTGNNVLTVNAGATAGTKTYAMDFRYRYGGAAQGTALCDVYSALTLTTVNYLTLTAATFQGRTLLIELDAAELQNAGVQYDWVTVNFDGTASGTCTISAFAILSQPRYAKAINATSIA